MNTSISMAGADRPTLLGHAASRIPTAGKIRAGIQVLTRKAAESARARELYEEGVAAGRTFEQIAQAISEAVPQLRYPLVPRNVPWFTLRAQDFPNPETARQILDTYAEDRGDGRHLYRFPVVFPSDQWQVVMPHELAAWATHEKRYWSEYAADGRTRLCMCHAPVPTVGQRAVRLFGGRKAVPRPDNGGLCDPEACAEYQARQCNLSGRFLFFIPGTRSLCFDAGCNSKMVAAWRKAQRDATADSTSATSPAASGAKRGAAKTTRPPKPTQQTPPRVIEYRTAQWRKWLANALMADAERSAKVLVALALSGRAADVRADELGKLVARLAGGASGRSLQLKDGLLRADRIDGAVMGRIVQGVAASAAFGADRDHLETLLNYMAVDESRYFKWDSAFLELFTISELESLALSTGLAEAMGARYRTARAGKKSDFITALLAVKGFAYPVPDTMRYPRRAVYAHGAAPAQEAQADETDEVPDAVAVADAA